MVTHTHTQSAMLCYILCMCVCLAMWLALINFGSFSLSSSVVLHWAYVKNVGAFYCTPVVAFLLSCNK